MTVEAGATPAPASSEKSAKAPDSQENKNEQSILAKTKEKARNLGAKLKAQFGSKKAEGLGALAAGTADTDIDKSDTAAAPQEDSGKFSNSFKKWEEEMKPLHEAHDKRWFQRGRMPKKEFNEKSAQLQQEYRKDLAAEENRGHEVQKAQLPVTTAAEDTTVTEPTAERDTSDAAEPQLPEPPADKNAKTQVDEEVEITQEMLNRYKELNAKAGPDGSITAQEAAERWELQQKLLLNADIEDLEESGIFSKGQAETEGATDTTDTVKAKLKELGIPLSDKNAKLLLEMANTNPDSIEDVMTQLDNVRIKSEEAAQLFKGIGVDMDSTNFTMTALPEVVKQFQEQFNIMKAEANKGDEASRQKAERMSLVLGLLLLLLRGIGTVVAEGATELASAASK